MIDIDELSGAERSRMVVDRVQAINTALRMIEAGEEHIAPFDRKVAGFCAALDFAACLFMGMTRTHCGDDDEDFRGVQRLRDAAKDAMSDALREIVARRN